jgi:hypothetical protein
LVLDFAGTNSFVVKVSRNVICLVDFAPKEDDVAKKKLETATFQHL